MWFCHRDLDNYDDYFHRPPGEKSEISLFDSDRKKRNGSCCIIIISRIIVQKLFGIKTFSIDCSTWGVIFHWNVESAGLAVANNCNVAVR